jgi:hypothetical protein
MTRRPVPAPEECAQEQLRNAPERIEDPATVAQLACGVPEVCLPCELR